MIHSWSSPFFPASTGEEYTRKYKEFSYDPEPSQWDNGGLFEITPQTALAWTAFTDDPTKFVLG